MSILGSLICELVEDVAFSPDGPTAEPQAAGRKNPQSEEMNMITDEEEDDEDEVGLRLRGDEEEEEEEEEMSRSAHLEPSTLPWPGDKDKGTQMDPSDGVWSEEGEERDTGISGGSQDLSERQSQEDSDRKSKAKWRESMPEGERWRDEEMAVQKEDKGDGSLADDEDEGDEEEEAEGEESRWLPEKAAMGFTPQVTIVNPSSKKFPEESRLFIERDDEKEPRAEPYSPMQYYPEYSQQDDKYYLCEHVCGGRLRAALAMAAAGLLFPLLVWGGYELLPFDAPQLESAPIRVAYTLRCSFFATIPILLGVIVQGVARVRHNNLKPLYQGELLNREVSVHWHYVNESLALFLFYFLQLAVMATYLSQELVKLVPLLTIIFVFGRLIYWLCLSLGSSIRGLGFGFSFFPILVMVGVNFYYICSSVGQEAVFDVAPPTTAPPPRQRWWG